MYLNSSCLLIVVSVRLAPLPRRSLFLDGSSIVYSQAFAVPFRRSARTKDWIAEWSKNRERERERGKKKGWRKVVREPTKIFLIMTSRGIFFFALFTRKLRERESWRKSRRLIDAMEIADKRRKGWEGGGEGKRAIRSSFLSLSKHRSYLSRVIWNARNIVRISPRSNDAVRTCPASIPGLSIAWISWNGEWGRKSLRDCYDKRVIPRYPLQLNHLEQNGG